MDELRSNCPMRHENGNCMPLGGFCTAVNNPICEALHNAFESGKQSQLEWVTLTLAEQSPWFAQKQLAALQEIHEKATAVNAVEVIRCEDCKYRELAGTAPFMYHCCVHSDGLTGVVRENDFCSHGERRQE